MILYALLSAFFFFNDTATTEIYTLSLHDALPIFGGAHLFLFSFSPSVPTDLPKVGEPSPVLLEGPDRSNCRWPSGCKDRKSTRLNSSHSQISYAVFCLKNKPQTLFVRLYKTQLQI